MEPPALLQAMAARTGATYELLSDESYALIDYFGVRHRGGREDGVDIARSATFILDRDGNILWKFATDNYRVRPRPEQILAEIDRILAFRSQVEGETGETRPTPSN